MKIIDITKKLPFKNSNGTMDPKKIDTVVVHHDAQFRPERYSSLARYVAQAKYHITKGFGHISYHYIIDNIGDIYQCLPETEVAYHCGVLSVNRKSIAVKFDGNMETQQLTPRQLKAYKELMIYLTTQRPDLPKVLRPSIKGHKEVKPTTACPGKFAFPIIPKL